MRNIRIIAGLTVREAVRHRLFLLTLVISLLFFLVSLMPTLFGARDVLIKQTGQQQSVAVLLSVFMGIPMLKFFSAVLAIGLASGAVSGEIERGLLAVILPKPIGRWQLLVGKWLGINLLMLVNLLFWAFLLWCSLLIQTHRSYPTLFRAGFVSALYPVIGTTLGLFFSTWATGTVAMGLALVLAGASWPHAFLRTAGANLNVPVLVQAGRISRYIVPASHVELWVERALGPLMPAIINPGGFAFNVPFEPSVTDLVYVAGYVVVFFVGAVVIFQWRDVR